MKKKSLVYLMCAAMCLGAPVTALAEETAVEAADDNQLSAPVDFSFDPATGEYSFTTTDERMGYYFVRVYSVEDGVEASEYVVSSKRINGGKCDTYTGTVDLSDIGWSQYHVNLVSFAPAGTDYVAPDMESITVQYGVDQTLERPEFLVMASGNTAEFVIDWYTLCDYDFCQLMPDLQLNIYSDEACTEVVSSEVIHLKDLEDTLSMNPTNAYYIWGCSITEGLHWFQVFDENGEPYSMMFERGDKFVFTNDVYSYELGAGTYYATAQAISTSEYSHDSEVSTVVEFTLTDDEPTADYVATNTELWEPPFIQDMPGSNPGLREDRVDGPLSQEISAIVIE